MKASLCILGLACLLASTAINAQASATAAPVYPVVTDISSDVRLVRFSPDVAVEQLHGVTALAHLRNLLARHPEAFAKSVAEMRAKGFKPTQDVFVERTLDTHLVKGDPGVKSPYSLIQTSSESNSQGEIDFWSYDGTGDNWDGTIYMEVYDYGASTWDGEIDTGSSDFPWNWSDKTWDNGCAGPRCDGRGGPPQIHWKPLLPGQMTRGGIALASLRRDHKRMFQLADWQSWYDWSVCWRQGVLAGCGSAAMGCMRSKAAFPACFGLWCVGAEIGSGIGCAL